MKSFIKIIVFGFILFLISCAHSPKREAFDIEISVEPIEGKDSWRVTYNSSRPINELIFKRQTNRFRSKRWRSLTQNVTIVEQEGEEKIQSQSKFVTATFEVESYYEETPKDYEFFLAFSDKSVSMYTGHLSVCEEDPSCAGIVDYKFHPPSGGHGIVAGKVFSETQHWRDDTGRGTYVYFGTLKPLQTKDLTALIDPQLPKWLQRRLTELLPKLFALYERKTSQPLTFKPFIFVSYLPVGEGNQSSGGTLPGLIQTALAGKGWSKEDPELFIDLARFLAHESAHIWNGQLFRYESNEMWMHEGGADAFAYRALRELKIISQERLNEYQTDALNECLSRVKDRPLRVVTEDPNYTAYYRCGAIYSLMTEAAFQKKDPKLDIFSFWKELFERSKSSNRYYTEKMYFDVLDDLSGEKATSAAIRMMLDSPQVRALDVFLAEFNRLGVPTSQDLNIYPRSYNLRISRGLLREIMKKDCNGKVGQTQSTNGIATEAFADCSTFNRPLYVTHLAGLKITSHGAKAYDIIQKGCLSSGYKIKVGARSVSKDFLLTCPDKLPQRDPYVSIKY